MSKLILTLLTLIIVVVGGGAYVVTKRATTHVTASSDPIYLVAESGTVTYRLPKSPSFVTVSSSTTAITNETIVRTNTTGRATVLLPSNAMISMNGDTEITVHYSASSTTIFQSLGVTYHRVQKLLSGETYQVQTPGTLAAVRGTKFAVSYDTKKQTTLVSVTEHQVAVSKVRHGFDNQGTNEEGGDTVMVDAGKMARVEVTATTTAGGAGTTMTVVANDQDTDMKAWMDDNKAKDDAFDRATENGDKDRDSSRDEVKRMLDIQIDSYKDEHEKTINDTNDQSKSQDTKVDTVVKTDEKAQTETKTDTTSQKTEEKTTTKTTVDTTPTVKVDTSVTTKLSEEAFFNQFSDLFIKYFYVDASDSACTVTATPQGRVDIVSSFAIKSGWPFTSGSNDTLLRFATDIDSYCKNKKGDASIRAVLQSRFDDEFPFKQNL